MATIISLSILLAAVGELGNRTKLLLLFAPTECSAKEKKECASKDKKDCKAEANKDKKSCCAAKKEKAA